MIYSIYPSKDSTIYNSSIYQNTGLDEIIELNKVLSGSSSVITANSRIMMKYNSSDITDILTAAGISTADFRIRCYTADVHEIPLSYVVEARAVSQSWEMGVGKFEDSPPITDGVSWRYRDIYLGNAWATDSLAPGSENFYDAYSYPGGATWYSAYQATQSFEFESTDININVSTIVDAWLDDSIVNDGFIIKRTNNDEAVNSNMGALKFFSRDTHTIYPPKLEIAWDDSVYGTGSLIELTSDDQFLVYSPNLELSYREYEKAKIRMIGREKYPTRSYVTSSVYTAVNNCLPETTYYSIVDASSLDTVIPFDVEYTKLSCDANGNYFKLWMDSFQAERQYRILIKVVTSDTEELFDDFTFKVVR